MVDLLPEHIRRWQAVEAVAREHFRRAGIEEIRTPLLEVTELFARGIGEGSTVTAQRNRRRTRQAGGKVHFSLPQRTAKH